MLPIVRRTPSGRPAGPYRRGKPYRNAGFGPVLLSSLFLLFLTGCSSTQLDQIPHGVGGLPEAAPARPETPYVFPAVNDLPPPRDQPLLGPEEQKKLENELARARKGQAGTAAAIEAGSTGQSRNP